MKKRYTCPTIFVLMFALLISCAGDKTPAEQAIKAAEEALNAVKGEAMKYIPDQVKGVENTLTAAKESFNKKDYKSALSQAKDVAAKAKDLAAAAGAKKTELTKNWEEMSGGLPKMVEAIKSRVDILSASKKLPANLDKAKLEGAKAGLAEITQMWGDAQKAFEGGGLADAISKAKMVKDKAAEIMTTLGMKVPEAAKS